MREFFSELTTGALNRFNLVIAAVGPISALTLEEKARIFAALATGAWFCVQIVFAAIDRRRKASRSHLDGKD